jgi:hypothetical protein
LTTTIEEPRLLTDTKSFYVGVAGQMDERFVRRLAKMDKEISEYIDKNADLHPSTKVMITSAMGENIYAVTVVITKVMRQKRDIVNEEV